MGLVLVSPRMQPLRQMGVLAAETVLQRINAQVKQPYPKEIIVEPDFVIRGSTGPAPRIDRQK
jgi:DNA-binding LacI/PurR family transcriptional regulator